MYKNRFFSNLIICIPFLLIFSFLIIPSACLSATYYIDAKNGNDSSSGTSQSEAWKTLSKINSSSFSPGDTIRFKRGEVWRGNLIINDPGSAGAPITFSAYGEGDKPLILGSVDGETLTWSETAPGSHKWSTNNGTFPKDPNIIYYDTFNNPDNPSYGTKIANSNDLNADWEFWYDTENEKIIIYHSSGNPATQANGIEIPQYDTGSATTYTIIRIVGDNTDYIVLDNLDIRYARSYGLWNWQGDNITLQNLDFKFCHFKTIYSERSDNVLFSNIYIHRCGLQGPMAENIFIYGSNNVTVNNVEIFVPHNIGIMLVACNGVTIQNCYVHDGEYDYVSWDSGIYINGSDNCIVQYNLVENCASGFGVNAEAYGQSTNNAFIHYNIAKNNRVSFTLGCNQNEKDVSNVYIYNNTFFKDKVFSGYAHDINLRYVDGLVFKNNIISNTDDNLNTALLKWYDSTTSNVTLDYNCWYASSSRYYYDLDSGFFKSLSDFQTGTLQGIHSLTSDPLFTDPANTDFSLQALSPCREAGTDVGLTQDINGTILPQGLHVDIGTFEYKTILQPPQNFRIINP